MIKMRKITRKVIALASAFAMTLPMFSTTAFAKELPVAEVTTASSDNNGILPRVSWVSVGTYGAGEYQMEYVNFKDKTNGAIRTYNTQYMRIKPAWKATDSSTSEVELLVKVIRKSNGDVAYSHRFKLSEDTDGHKDGEGGMLNLHHSKSIKLQIIFSIMKYSQQMDTKEQEIQDLAKLICGLNYETDFLSSNKTN